MKIYVIFVTILIFISISLSKENDNQTDGELINICLRNVGKKLADALLQKGYKNISVVKDTSGEEKNSNFILMESFAKEIRKQNGSLFLKRKDFGADTPILSYRIIEKRISIEEKNRFFSEPLVKRRVKVNISYRLIDPMSGEFLIAEEIGESIENSISQKTYMNLKKGMIKKGGSYTSLLEPAILTAIIGGLMYLFYSQKSSK